MENPTALNDGLHSMAAFTICALQASSGGQALQLFAVLVS